MPPKQLFKNSVVIQEIWAVLTTLLAEAGSSSPDNWEATIADLRAVTGYAADDFMGVTASETIYQFDSTATDPDNGETVITPNDITEPAAGRWLKVLRFSLAGHSHNEKADKPSETSDNEIALFDAAGNLKKSNKLLSAFVEAVEGMDLSQNSFTNELLTKLNDLPSASTLTSDLNKKLPVPTFAIGNVGKLLTLGSDGQLVVTTIDPATIPSANPTILNITNGDDAIISVGDISTDISVTIEIGITRGGYTWEYTHKLFYTGSELKDIPISDYTEYDGDEPEFLDIAFVGSLTDTTMQLTITATANATLGDARITYKTYKR